MEIYAVVVDAVSGEPLQGATVQRLYPDKQIYSSPILSDENGWFNGRVPGRDYFWKITHAGYKPLLYPLTNAVHDGPDAIVRLERNDMLPEVVVTPTSGSKKSSMPWIILAIAAGVVVADRQKWIKIF